MNPFKYGRVVSDEDFCPRPDLIKQLAAFVKNGQNVLLQGERRIGKTSLIYETLRGLKRYRMVYIDLLEIKAVDDLCRRVIKAIISAEKKVGLLEKILKGLSHLRPVISFDPSTGQPTVSLDAAVKLKPDSVEGLLDLLKQLGRRGSLVVVFDEFQDILNLPDANETLAVLRSKIQFHKNIPYVFAGSMRNKMNEIFISPESAFFKSAIPMEIGSLDADIFVRFLNKKFSLGKRKIEKETLLKVLGMAENVPGDVQELCGAIWETSSHGDKIRESNLLPALELIYARESKGYEATLVQVTGQQLRCLVAMAKMGGRAPLSSSFIQSAQAGLPASVKKALNRMMQLKIVYRSQGEYKFVNPFFKSWLIWKNY